jgi:hypothetical protein
MPIASPNKARDMARRRHSVDSYVDSIVDRADELHPDHVSRIVAAAPHPSTWTPEQTAELQRLLGPLVRTSARSQETAP